MLLSNVQLRESIFGIKCKTRRRQHWGMVPNEPLLLAEFLLRMMVTVSLKWKSQQSRSLRVSFQSKRLLSFNYIHTHTHRDWSDMSVWDRAIVGDWIEFSPDPDWPGAFTLPLAHLAVYLCSLWMYGLISFTRAHISAAWFDFPDQLCPDFQMQTLDCGCLFHFILFPLKRSASTCLPTAQLSAPN